MFLILMLLTGILPVNALNVERPVRVLLTITSNIITFENQDGIELLNENGDFLAKSDSFTVRVLPKGFVIDKKTIHANLLLIRPLSKSAFTLINAKKRYRGAFFIKQEKERFYLINVVFLEDYVAGVVGGEMPASWHLESLKAQAVVARTYAAKKMTERVSHPYDLVDTVMDQVYEGVSGEHPLTLKAVSFTKGEILTYKSDIVTAYYHADCGGMTEEGSNVFPGELSYLPSIECSFHANSPYKNWSKTITSDELKRLLELSGYEIQGEIEDVRFLTNENTKTPQGSSALRGTSRINLVSISHKGGVLDLPSKVFRQLIGPRDMRSTYGKIEVLEETFISSTEPGESFPPELKGNISIDIDFSGEEKHSYASAKGQVYLMETFNPSSKNKDTDKDTNKNIDRDIDKHFNKVNKIKETVKFVEVEETVPFEQKKQQVALLSRSSSLIFVAGQGALSTRSSGNDRPFLVLGLGGKWIRRWDFQVAWMESSRGAKQIKKKVPVTVIIELPLNNHLLQDNKTQQSKQLLQDKNLLQDSKMQQENQLPHNKKLLQDNSLHKNEIPSQKKQLSEESIFQNDKQFSQEKQLTQNSQLPQDIKIQPENQLPSTSFRIVKKKVPALFKISGRGWGHGVGLCQWGAKGMAEKGYNYKQILHYYYKDVQI